MRPDRHALVALTLLILAAAVGAPGRAAAQDDDPWLGTDKGLQFGIGFGVAAIGYGVGRVTFEARLDSALFGFGVSVGAAGVKELMDLTLDTGTASWRDLAWGVVGAGLGVIVAWLVDLAIHGAEPSVPHELLEPRAVEESVPLLPTR